MNEDFRLDTTPTKQEISSKKSPKGLRWLLADGYSLSARPRLPVDFLEEDGTALDTVRHRPGHRFKTSKRVGKKLAEAEEWIDFLRKKGKLRNE